MTARPVRSRPSVRGSCRAVRLRAVVGTGVATLLVAVSTRASESVVDVAPTWATDTVRSALVSAGWHAPQVRLATWKPALPAGCVAEAARVASPASTLGSREVTLRLSGHLPSGSVCEGWATSRIEASARVWVATRTLTVGKPMAGAVTQALKPIVAGDPGVIEVPSEALAAQPLASGQMVQARHLQLPGQGIGDPVEVDWRSGSVSIRLSGKIVSCGAGRVCAQLTTGKRVEGRFEGGRLVVEGS